MPSSEMQDGSTYASEMESNERIYDIIAIASGAGLVFALSVVGLFALDSLSYGLFSGVMAGSGSYLFLAAFFRFAAIQEDRPDDLSTDENITRIPDYAGRGVLGFGLETGGIVMIAIGFTFGEPTLFVGASGGIGVALVVYLLGSVWLDRHR